MKIEQILRAVLLGAVFLLCVQFGLVYWVRPGAKEQSGKDPLPNPERVS
jgi:hypothetical protein